MSDDLRGEVQRAHWRLDEHDEKLRMGADTFSKIREEMKVRLWVRWVQIIGLIGFVATLSFAAGKYPDRKEWDQTTRDTQRRFNEIAESMNELKLHQVKQDASLEQTTEQLDLINDKLDKVLLNNEPRKRRR